MENNVVRAHHVQFETTVQLNLFDPDITYSIQLTDDMFSIEF